MRRLQTTVPDVEFQLIRFEQERSEARGLGESLLAELRAESGEDPTLVVQRAAADLLEVRREMLDELIRRYGRFSTQLVEQESVTGVLLGELEQVQAFLYEQLPWVRSVPRPIIPRPVDVLDGLGWLVASENWSAATRTVKRNGHRMLPSRARCS